MRLILGLALAMGGALFGWRLIERTYGAAPVETDGPFRAAIGDCDLPQPSKNAVMVFAGYYEGAAISSIRLKADDPQEEATTALDVHVTPGFSPIYLVLVGDRRSVVRFTGWTRRIERVVTVTSTRFPAAIAGLPRERVRFADAAQCGVLAETLYEPNPQGVPLRLADLVKRPQPDGLSVEQRARLPQYRMPDVTGGGYDPAVLTIGSGRIEAKIYAPHDHDAALPEWQRNYADFDPAGVYEIEPGALVSPVAAERYTLLPGRFGIAQLVRDGKLEARGLDDFRVLAPITAPAGLYGAESVTFEVPNNVPDPKGDLGHSKIKRI